MVELRDVFERLARAIDTESASRREEDLPPLGHTEIRVMGQMSLLSNPEVQAQIRLFGTRDVDATVRGEYWVQKKFEEFLLEQGLELDSVANEIWLPKEATFSEVYSSPKLTCLRLDPIYALVSKAIKAKEKNRILIRQALPIFGDELRSLIEEYGGDLTYFEVQE
jgi:hypothetical protein